MRNKIEDLLSRAVALEADFATLPGDVDEQRRRHQLILYVVQSSPLELDIEFFPAISRRSRRNCGLPTTGRGCSDLLAMFKMKKMRSGFSRICERPSQSTRSVHHIDAILDADVENRWHSEWRIMNKGTKR